MLQGVATKTKTKKKAKRRVKCDSGLWIPWRILGPLTKTGHSWVLDRGRSNHGGYKEMYKC